MTPPLTPFPKFSLGIFAKTFPRSTVAATFDGVAALGLRSIQFNFSCCGLPTLPDRIEPALLDELRTLAKQRSLRFAAISATFNLIHPDPAVRSHGRDRLPVLAEAAKFLDCPLLTLCTGTRDPVDMWRAHPDNPSPAAWRDLRLSIDSALAATESSGILLGIEPETSNAVDSARSCRRLLDETNSPRLRVVMDPANLLSPGDLARQVDIIVAAFDLLGDSITLAHAKELGPDLRPDGRGPGRGVIDWPAYVQLLHSCRYAGPIVLHGLQEAETAPAVLYLSRIMEGVASFPAGRIRNVANS
ncbi:MAG: sugar phosphate isomerase/epimerase [Pedosphaera sp.]|nr:sugar phosphate isomerase/epimerase [Pedosphaera sp.]